MVHTEVNNSYIYFIALKIEVGVHCIMKKNHVIIYLAKKKRKNPYEEDMKRLLSNAVAIPNLVEAPSSGRFLEAYVR